MALADTAKLLASLDLQDRFTPKIKNANRALDGFDAKLDKTETRAFRAGQQIGTGIKRGAAIAAVGVGILATQVALGLRSLVELEQQEAQTNAVIKSTGGVAGVTAAQVGLLAEKYEGLNATIGDEVIRSGENLLLTFTNIREKAFEPALQAALDMNTAMGKGPDGLTATIKTLGKALNDPTKGLGALSKVGVTFSEEQTKRIKQLQKEGKLYEAQAIILGELDKRFGGSFLGQGGTTAGKVAKFTDSIEDLQRALATALLPAVGNIADALTEFLQDPQTIADIKRLGESIGKLFSPENIRTGIGLLRDAVGTLRSIAGPIADIIGGAVKAFTSLPPDIQKLLIGGFAVNKLTGGLVTNIASGIFGALKAMTVQAAVVNVTGGVVNGGGARVPPGTGPGTVVTKDGGLIGTIKSALKGFILTALAVTAAEIAVAGIGDINNPKHQTPDGKGGTRTFRSSNVVEDQLRNINRGIDRLRDRAANGDTVAQKQLAALIELRTSIESGQKKPPPLPPGTPKNPGEIMAAALAADRTTTAVESAKSALFSELSLTTGAARIISDSALPAVGAKVDATKGAVDTARTAIDGAKRATEIGASTVAGAINRKDLSVDLLNKTTVNVYVSATGVKTSSTYQNRVGKSTGSHGGAGSGYSGHAGGH